MHLRLLDVLACPQCAGVLRCEATTSADDGEVIEGKLVCAACAVDYPIVQTIPRFVPHDNYAASFGYQWNLFRREQMDTDNGAELSAQRFFSETGWTAEQIRGRWVLDMGCGAGRFLEVVTATGAEAIGLDISSAIDATRENLTGAKNVHLVQASALAPPFRKDAIDFVYCIGVIQHTPDPAGVMRLLPRLARGGGEVAVTVYERKPWTWLNAKYLVRPFTRKMPKERLLQKIRKAMPVLFPLTNVLFRLPLIGRLFEFTIPVANYVRETALSRGQRYDWAVLDTFDMLSPAFDQPQTIGEIERALGEGGLEDMRRLPNPGANVVGRKP
ncbi:MAG TPA: methyltransferase domain-containing protein [Caulobacteraceae bacterium]